MTLISHATKQGEPSQMIEFHYQVVIHYMSTFADMIQIQCACNHNDTKKIPGNVTDWLLIMGEYS